MNYRQNKNKNNKKYVYFAIGAILLLFLLSYLTFSAKGGVASSWVFFRPIMTFKNNASLRLENWGTYFSSKKNLALENENLKTKNLELESKMSNYNILLKENEDLKNILNRKIEREFILGNILIKPNKSLYDTMLVDVGTAEGVRSQALVFAFGNIPLGYVSEVSLHTASIVLYSTSKETTSVVDSSTGSELEAVGRGGGNFEVVLPRDFEINIGEDINLPGVPYTLARVEGVISDPRDSFKKALLKSPINIFELKYVQIEK